MKTYSQLNHAIREVTPNASNQRGGGCASRRLSGIAESRVAESRIAHVQPSTRQREAEGHFTLPLGGSGAKRPGRAAPKFNKTQPVSPSQCRIHLKYRPNSKRPLQRSGSASMDLFLVIGIIIPMVAFLYMVVPRMIQLVYEMAVVIIGNPLM